MARLKPHSLISNLSEVRCPVVAISWNLLFVILQSTLSCVWTLNSLPTGCVLRVSVSVLSVVWLSPWPVAGMDTTGGQHGGHHPIDYDYGDNSDPYLDYRKWQEQSMLGKGQKIGQDLPPDHPPLSLDPGWTDNPPISPYPGWTDKPGLSVRDPTHRQSKEGHEFLDVSTRGGSAKQPVDTSGQGRVPYHIQHGSPHSVAGSGVYVSPGLPKPPGGSLNRARLVDIRGDHAGDDTVGGGGHQRKQTQMVKPVHSVCGINTGNSSTLDMATNIMCPNNITVDTARRPISETADLSQDERPVIYLAGLFPVSENIPAGSVGRGVLPAVELALQHINYDPKITRKYRLKMASNDTRCDMAVATKAFFDMMAESQTITAMLFGDVCFNVTGPMVQIAHQWGMYQLAYADTNPVLSDRDQFPNFYRTVPSDSDFNPARLALLQHFNWTTVGTIFQDAKLGEARHGYASNRFDSLVEKFRINISIVESFADDPDAAIKKLKIQDVRIIVGNFDQAMARQVFCSARQNSMYGPKYQWIILGTYDDDWWTVDDHLVTCSVWELNDTIHGYLATDALPLSTNHDVTESGLTADEYLQDYNQARGSEFSKYHGYAYDGVWVVAKALDRLLEEASLTPELFRGPVVGRVLNETNFIGVTGRVQFQNGDRLGSITISQMQYGSMVKVGEYHALTHTLDLGDGSLIIWRDGKPPMDRSIKIEELRHVSFPVYIAFVVMAALGITMAVLFLAVNIRYRRHRYIKMSSPNMNNLIIVGCVLCYMSIFLLGADPDHTDRLLFSYWCTARSWTLALGFTLAFGAMFGKTWRVHAIFTNIKLNKKVIKDYKLMLIVLVLVLIDVMILVTWQVVDPFDKAVKRLTPEVYVDYEVIPKLDYCSSSRMEIWLGTLYAYKGLLLAFGCFLAWETRHVSIPALNDSKYIGMSVYNVVIMCVCGAAVSFIIEDRPTESFIIIGLFIIFCTTITLCLVFLPKIVQLKRNPKGTEQRVRATLGNCTKKSQKSEYSVHREKLRATLEENRRLRGFLEQKASELENLIEQLGDDAIKEDAGLRSALLHKTVLDLRNTEGSPGKMSMKSYSASDYESSYSEGSATTCVYLNDDPAPTTSLLMHRFNNSKLYSEAIEMAGIRFNARKTSLTIPPASEDEVEDDPFGGVYLGPSDSPTKLDLVDGDEGVEERLPLMTSSSRGLPHRAESTTSGDSLLDSSSGAPEQTKKVKEEEAMSRASVRRQLPRSLRLRRHSAPLAIWTIAESRLEESPDTAQSEDTRPLVQPSPCTHAAAMCPENLAMTSPMTPSPLNQTQYKLQWTRKVDPHHSTADSQVPHPADISGSPKRRCDLDTV